MIWRATTLTSENICKGPYQVVRSQVWKNTSSSISNIQVGTNTNGADGLHNLSHVRFCFLLFCFLSSGKNVCYLGRDLDILTCMVPSIFALTLLKSEQPIWSKPLCKGWVANFLPNLHQVQTGKDSNIRKCDMNDEEKQ